MRHNISTALKAVGLEEPTWPLPDMSVLNAGRRPAPTMPSDIFGNTWPLICDLAEGAGSPADYVGLGFLGVCASLIGGKRKIRPYSEGTWAEPAILWCALVGDPSSNKSPAIDAVTAPLRDMERDHAASHSQAIRDWEAAVEMSKAIRASWLDDVKAAAGNNLSAPPVPDSAVAPNEPERRRLMVMDATPEALGSILAGNPAGTLNLRDELSGWLTTFDRYSPGGRPFWLEAYGGRQFVVDRKGSKGPLQLDFLGVSILGGIQPQKLAEALLDAADDGLAARFLWAWPESIPYNPPRALADTGALANLYRRLDGLQWGLSAEGRDIPVTLPLATTAKDLLVEWIRENSDGMEDHSALYQGLVGKMRGGVLRLALVSELLTWACSGGPEPREVSAGSLAKAIEFVDGYVKPAALRVFGDAALPSVERNAAVLARYIRRKCMVRVNARDLKQSPHKQHLPGMREAAPLDDALAHLEEAGVLREMPSREGGTAGRSKRDYLVNPAFIGGDNGQVA